VVVVVVVVTTDDEDEEEAVAASERTGPVAFVTLGWNKNICFGSFLPVLGDFNTLLVT